MKRLRKMLILLLCVMMVQIPAVPASAKTPVKGWDSSRTHYYKNGKVLTGLRKIGTGYYYFNSKGVLQKNIFKKLKQNDTTYTFYFGSNGRAYRAVENEFYDAFVIKKINGKYYGFDANSHMITGIWANNNGKVYFFDWKTGLYNAKRSKKYRDLTTYEKKSKTLLADLKKLFGKPSKTRMEKNSCNAFDGYASKYYKDYVLTYKHVEIQLTYNSKNHIYFMSGVFPREK